MYTLYELHDFLKRTILGILKFCFDEHFLVHPVIYNIIPMFQFSFIKVNNKEWVGVSKCLTGNVLYI